MTTTAPVRAHPAANFTDHAGALAGLPVSVALADVRRAAFDRFREAGYPTTRDEDWRYTDVSPIARTQFSLPAADAGTAAAAILQGPLATVGEARLVFVNGVLSRAASSLGSTVPGLEIRGLADVVADNPGRAPGLVGSDAGMSGTFVDLNTGLFVDGAVVHVAPGVVVPGVINIVHVTVAGDTPAAAHPRVVVRVGELSQVTIAETYVGEHGTYLTNAVTEVRVGEGAVVDHYKVQAEGPDAYHIAAMFVRLARDARFSSHSFALGGSLVRNEVHAVLDGTGAEATLNGLYHLRGRQHVDNHTVLDHAQPHCSSHELYKGVLDGYATSAFSGKIIVREDAQKTDAKQTNQNLLLSPDAVADTRPQLEIWADDVRCTHGATIGQLDDDALYYLRTRGIGLAEARALLTRAFAGEIVDRVKPLALRRALALRLFGDAGDHELDAAAGGAAS